MSKSLKPCALERQVQPRVEVELHARAVVAVAGEGAHVDEAHALVVAEKDAHPHVLRAQRLGHGGEAEEAGPEHLVVDQQPGHGEPAEDDGAP